jgi:4-amino-4-deoxy-L-arabinose transferase-like glycosyltransferase
VTSRHENPDARAARPWSVIALVALALAVRGGVLALKSDSLARDPDGYRYLAENLVTDGTFGYGRVPTAYRPPLYPLVLTPCVALGRLGNAAIAALHLAMGVATVLLVYRLGRRWGLGRWSLLAAALVACDPILLVQSTLVMTETLAALLAVVSLLALTAASERPSGLRAAAAGACLALAVLCRPTFLPWMGLAALVLPTFAPTWRARLGVFASFVLAAAAVLAPWTVRNQAYFGRPIFATTHGGYTLLLGNNPSFYAYLRSGTWGTVWDADAFNEAWRARAPRTRPADEIRNERLAYAEALENIRREPGMFAYACLVRAGRLWAPLAHQVDPAEGLGERWGRYLVGAWYVAQLAFALAGLIWLLGGRAETRFSSGWFWGLLLAVCFTGVHVFYWSNLRMRAPLVPVVALAAVAGLFNRRGLVPRAEQCQHAVDLELQVPQS